MTATEKVAKIRPIITSSMSLYLKTAGINGETTL
jgi:hypothetical protein